MNCNYKVKIKDIQNKYQFKIFCKTYDDTEIQGDIETLQDDVEALQEENLYLNNLVEQAFDKKEVEGEELTIDDTINAKMEVGLEGNITQKTTTGKQLINNIRAVGTVTTLNGITFTTNEDGSIKANGTATSDFAFITCDQSQTQIRQNLLNKSLILTGCPAGGSNTTYFIQCFGYGGATVVDTGNGTSAFNFTNESGNWNVAIMIKNGTVCNNLIFKPMIRLSSITDNTYEEYTGGIASPNPDYPSNVNVVTGDNTIVVNGSQILNINDVPSTTKNGITYSVNDNVVILNGTSTANTFIKLELNRSIPSGKTISYSANNSKINSNVSVRPANNENALEVLSLDAVNKTRNNYTLPNDMNEVYIVVNNGTSLSNFEIKLMANIGTTALPYEEHQEQTYQVNLGTIELCKIGDYQDYLYKSNNKWYLHKQIGKVVLDGNITGSIISDIQNENTICFRTDAGVTNILSNSKPISNYFTAINDTSDVEHIRYIGTSGYRFQLFLSKQKATTANEVITWLSTHNTSVYYVLDTPTDTEITDTTLISQLEALKTAMSYAGQTNISQINNDAPFILKVTALASYNSRILALENAILNANRSTPVENTRKSNEVIEEPKEEVVDDNKDKNIIKEEK